MSHFIDRRLNGRKKSTVNRSRFIRRYKAQLKRSVADAVDRQALVAYNIGMNAARRVMDAADFKYVQKVERYMAVVVPRYNNKFPSVELVRTASM